MSSHLNIGQINLLNAPGSIPATPVSAIYCIYHCIELLPANVHLHIEELLEQFR